MNFFKLFNYVIQKKIKIKLNKLQKKNILVFDGVSNSDLEFLLEEFDFAVIENRLERIKEINLSPKTIFKLIKNFLNLILIGKKFTVSNLYFYTIIKLIKPKLVITSIDNSLQFHRLAKLLHNEISFFAIQNANRLDYLNNEYNMKNSLSNIDYNSQLFIPNFVCFGDIEEKLAKNLNLNIKKFFKYGSIRSANFFHYIKKEKLNLSQNLYDICLISELVFGFNKKYQKNHIEEGLGTIASYTIKFAIEKNLKFIFASKYPENSKWHNREIEFYKKHLSKEEFNYLIRNFNKKINKYSSYFAIFQSEVAVGCQSTLLRDKIGLREKILSSNLTDYENYNFPINGICTINNCNYKEFSLRLNKILTMDPQIYFENLDPCQVMVFDENNSTIDKVKFKIRECLY
jgi:surface carbohydrate biosynthesis protein